MKKKRILIYNDNSKRDLLGIRLLKYELENLGYLIKICNSQDADVKFRIFKPHAFIAARADNYISKQAGFVCKVFIVPGEGGHQTKETMLSVFMGRGYWKLDSVEWINKCYLWNKNSKKWLLDSGLFKENQLSVIGSPRLDIYKNPDLIENISKSKKESFKIGIAFSAKSTSTYYGHPNFAEVYYNFNPKMNFPITRDGGHFEDIVWRDHIILRKMMRVVRLCIEKSVGHVILRPSPFESPKEYFFLEKLYPDKIKIKTKQTLPEFLCEIDVLITCWSTVGIESLILNKPVISIAGLIQKEILFQHISEKASGFKTFVKNYLQPKSEKELLEFIESIKKKTFYQSDSKKLLNDLYNWNNQLFSSKLIAEDIHSQLKDEDHEIKVSWKKYFPLKIEIPLHLALLIKKLLLVYKALKSGVFKTYLGFYKNSSSDIENLFKVYKKFNL